MKLNGIELSKKDGDEILKELKVKKIISECDNDYQEFIKQCIKTNKMSK